MDEQNNQQAAGQQPPQQTPAPVAAASGQNHSQGFLASLEAFFQKYFVEKAPFHLPEKAKEVIVKISPWISLILLIIALPLLLAAFGFSLVTAPIAAAVGHSLGFSFWLAWIFILATVILEAMAISPLMKRQMRGWRFVYWAMLLAVISNVVSINWGGLIGNVIGLYILFQVKSKYQ